MKLDRSATLPLLSRTQRPQHAQLQGPTPANLRRSRLALAGLGLTTILMAGLAGCQNGDYALSAVTGELQLLSKAVPVEQALNDSSLSDEERTQLSLLLAARDYGESVIGLRVGNSYRNFVNLHGQSLAWNLSASRNDKFEPYIWNIPFAGPLPYLGFFDLDQAKAERDRVLQQGYDTMIYELDAYSTLGLLPDPITSNMLKRSTISLVDTVIHECLHNTIYSAQNTNFDESLATFVGRTGAIEFLKAHFGENDPIVLQAQNYYEDNDHFNTFLQGLIEALKVVYASDQSKEDKLVTKATTMQAARDRFASDVLPLMHDQTGYGMYCTFNFNNAFLLLNVRYNTGLDVFQGIYDLTGRDWGQALQIFSDAAAQDDPVGYLQGLLVPSSAPAE